MSKLIVELDNGKKFYINGNTINVDFVNSIITYDSSKLEATSGTSIKSSMMCNREFSHLSF